MEPIRVVAARQGLRKLARIPHPIEESRLTKLQEQPERKTTERGTATFVFPASLPTQKRLCPPETRRAEPLRSI